MGSIPTPATISIASSSLLVFLFARIETTLELEVISVADQDVNYQPVAPDATKSCSSCSNFKLNQEKPGMGDCFGHEVVATGTCNFFAPKAELQ